MNHPLTIKINFHTLAKIVLLMGYAVLFLYMLLSKKLAIYLHPRLFPFALFSGIVFILMAFALVGGLPTRTSRFSMIPYLVFLVPFLFLFVPTSPPSVSLSAISSSKIAGLNPKVLKSAKTSAHRQNLKLQPNQKAVYCKSPLGTMQELVITDNTITMNDKNYVSWLSELSDFPRKYRGKKIICVGYVYKSGTGFTSSEFIPTRDMMWCCAADLQLVGILCHYEKTPTLLENSWVKVTGTLDVTRFQNETVPVILDPTVTFIKKPANTYVYPNY